MLRRQFLKTIGIGAGTGMGLSLAARTPAGKRGSGENLKKMLVIFQRGGNDAFNTLVPVGNAGETADYQRIRPDLNIPSSRLLSFSNTDFFGYHPSFAPVADLIQAGKASFVHAVGYPDMSGSHFAAQAFWETGDPTNRRGSGWLNRYFHASTGAGAFRALMVENNIAQLMSGPYRVPVSTNFGLLDMPVPTSLTQDQVATYRQTLRQIAESADYKQNGLLEQASLGLLGMFDAFQQRNLDDYQPENGAAYPESDFGLRIKHAAQLLKEQPNPLSVEAVMVNHGGYDTHSRQIGETSTEGSHAELLLELFSGIRAFYRDLGDSMINDVLVLVISEFGRSAYQNGSRGCDHGNKGLTMLFGGSVNGRVVNGGDAWPGLESRRDAWRTDYRDIYWEILARHFGAARSEIQQALPNFNPNTVGVLS